jgi:hypothetical protein
MLPSLLLAISDLHHPGGSPEARRRAFNKDFLVALARDFQAYGEQVLARVRRESPSDG